jgi:Tfp pilus assembly protein PilF
LALLLLAAALLSKEQAIVLPAVFLLADALQVSEAGPRSDSRRQWFAAGGWVRRYLPVACIVVTYLLIRWSLFAHSSEHEFAVLQEPWRPLASLAFAIQTTFAPYFELRYEPRLPIWFAPMRFACASAVVILVTIRIRKQWKEHWRLILFWLSWIALSLLPTANIMRQEAMFAERYVFPSLLGTGAIIAMLAAGAWRPQLAIGLAAIAILYCGIVSLHRASYYADDQAFLSQWIRSDPQSFQARLSLGEHFFDQQDFDAARKQLQAALRLAPDLARAHNILGITSLALGDVENATFHSREAIRLDASDPDNRNNLGVVLAIQGELDAAAEQFQEAIRLQPAHVNSHLNLGKINANRNRHAEAVAYFRRTIELQWDHVEAYVRLGDSLAAEGKLPQAEAAYKRALEIQPDFVSARDRLQTLRREQGRRPSR